jgi:hypothetical protein
VATTETVILRYKPENRSALRVTTGKRLKRIKNNFKAQN